MEPEQSTDAREPKFPHPSRSTCKRVSVARSSLFLLERCRRGAAGGELSDDHSEKNVQTFTMKLRKGSKGNLFCVFQKMLWALHACALGIAWNDRIRGAPSARAGDCFTQALTRLLPTVQRTVNPKEQYVFLKWKHTRCQEQHAWCPGAGDGQPSLQSPHLTPLIWSFVQTETWQ